MKNNKYIGKIVDGFEIIENVDPDNEMNRDVIGRCVRCGNIQKISYYRLTHDNSMIHCDNCGYSKPVTRNDFQDLTGKRFGTLTVLHQAGRDKSKSVTWLCRCDCGNEVIRRGYQLRSNKACNGCINCKATKGKRLYQELKTKHNAGKITLCPEWLDNFEAFESWFKKTHKNNSCIYCTDKETNFYSEQTCMWISRVELYNYTRGQKKLVELNGERYNFKELSRMSGVPLNTLIYRYKRGVRGDSLISKAKLHQSLKKICR